MDVYDFINTFTDLCGVVVSIWDFDSERVVFDSGETDSYGSGDILNAIEEADLDSYDVEGVDLFRDENNKIHIEINISMGEPEDDDEDE